MSARTITLEETQQRTAPGRCTEPPTEVITMAQVDKKAGVTAWTGAWRLPTGKRDHERAVRAQRRRDRRDVAAQRRDYRSDGR